MFQKEIKYLDYVKDYQLQKNHSAKSTCDVAFLSKVILNRIVLSRPDCVGSQV